MLIFNFLQIWFKVHKCRSRPDRVTAPAPVTGKGEVPAPQHWIAHVPVRYFTIFFHVNVKIQMEIPLVELSDGFGSPVICMETSSCKASPGSSVADPDSKFL